MQDIIIIVVVGGDNLRSRNLSQTINEAVCCNYDKVQKLKM